MLQPPPFGRRAAAGDPIGGPEDPHALPEAAELFLRDLQQVQKVDAAFAAWRRDEGARRLHVWFLRVALFSPGLLAAALGAPVWATLALEGAGFVASIWFRHERKNHLRAIASWDGSQNSPGEGP